MKKLLKTVYIIFQLFNALAMTLGFYKNYDMLHTVNIFMCQIVGLSLVFATNSEFILNTGLNKD